MSGANWSRLIAVLSLVALALNVAPYLMGYDVAPWVAFVRMPLSVAWALLVLVRLHRRWEEAPTTTRP